MSEAYVYGVGGGGTKATLSKHYPRKDYGAPKMVNYWWTVSSFSTDGVAFSSLAIQLIEGTSIFESSLKKTLELNEVWHFATLMYELQYPYYMRFIKSGSDIAFQLYLESSTGQTPSPYPPLDYVINIIGW